MYVCFVFCELPDIDVTTTVGPLVLMMIACLAKLEACWVGECIKEALSAAKA